MITDMFRFETPWALAAVILPLLLWLWRKRRRSRIPALKVATADLMRGLPRTLRSRLAWLPAALMTAAWVLLTIALARPQSGQEQLKDVSQGIAIEMVLDRSGSMRFPMKYHGQQLTRLEVVKDVFADFAFGNRDLKLPGRHSDLLGVIAFAHYPYTICPLTLDHNALRFALKNVEMVTEDTDENGTAIGDAVAMAVARLETVEQTLAAQTKQDASTYRIKSKVIIVLTDGQDEGPHTRSITEAAKLALSHGIKVYSIAMIAGGERVINTPFGQMPIGSAPQYDTSEIEEMAESTGGIFRTCDSAEALAEVYREIDLLEKSEVEALRYVTHRELYLPFAAGAFASLLAAILLNASVFRRLP